MGDREKVILRNRKIPSATISITTTMTMTMTIIAITTHIIVDGAIAEC